MGNIKDQANIAYLKQLENKIEALNEELKQKALSTNDEAFRKTIVNIGSGLANAIGEISDYCEEE